MAGEKILFEVDLDKVKRSIADWGLFTSDDTRDRAIDAFYALIGSAQLNLGKFPEMQKRVIQKVDDYIVAANRWRQEGRTITKMEERMLRGVSEIETLLKIPENEQTTKAPLDPAKDQALTNAINNVNQRMDSLEAEARADAAAKRRAEEAEKEKKEIPFWVVPVAGAAAYFVVPKVLARFF